MRAVQGHTVGGGFQLALGADIRMLADDAQFCMAEPALGIVPDLGGTKRLVELVGYSRAAEICLTGRRVAADEALRIGLASHVVPRDELDAATERLVDALLAVDRDAAAETKALLARRRHPRPRPPSRPPRPTRSTGGCGRSPVSTRRTDPVFDHGTAMAGHGLGAPAQRHGGQDRAQGARGAGCSASPVPTAASCCCSWPSSSGTR